jgi:hypothetical protein
MNKIGHKVTIVLVLVAGFASGYYWHYSENKEVIIAGENMLAGFTIDAFLEGDVSDRVVINCFRGNMKKVTAKEAGVIFSAGDFDEDGTFTNHRKTFLIQPICEVSEKEQKIMMDKILDGEDNGIGMFEVVID